MNTSIVPIERADDGALAVSSQTIAEGSGVQHKNVLELISANIADLEEFGQVAFETRPRSAGRHGGGDVRIALLNEQQATLVMTYQRNTDQVKAFKLALVKAFFEMAKQLKGPAQPLSADEIVAQALQITSARVKALESKVEADAPKVTYVEKFVADNDYHLFRTVASDLNVGEMELRWALVYAGWLYHDSQRRRNSKGEIVTEHQWSEYASKKAYFHRSPNHQAPLFKGNVAYTLKVKAPGAAAIARFVERQIADHGSLTAALPALEASFNARKKAS